MKKEYYICSQLVVDLLKPIEVSRAVKVYPNIEYLTENVYVAVLDFQKAKNVYESFDENSDESFNFWCEEIVPGQMNVDSITLKDFEKQDPWSVIENKLNLTKDNNRAMTICNICEREGINPIEFWNNISIDYEIRNIRDEFAKEKGYESWSQMFYLLISANHYNKIYTYSNEVMRRIYENNNI